MRILHLLNHTNRLNGHVHAAVDLACEQVKLGHQVCVASGGGNFDALLAKHRVESAQIDHTRRILTLARAIVSLHTLVRRWKPDVIHAHMMTSAVLAWPICKLAGIQLVTTVHNEFEKSAILMGLGDRVIGVSKAVSQSMRKRGVSASRLRVVLNGTIGSARFERSDAAAVSIDAPSIVFVGGLHPRKGLPYLLQGFDKLHARHPEANLYIIGEGPHQDAYKTQAETLESRGSIHFLGSRENPFPYMAAADIFVLPSLADPAPLVICEAREAGCAIIASNVGGIPELLDDGQAGMLVPSEDAEAIAESLNTLLSDRDLLAEWKRRSQVRLDHLTINRVARETLKIYGEAISQGGEKIQEREFSSTR